MNTQRVTEFVASHFQIYAGLQILQFSRKFQFKLKQSHKYIKSCDASQYANSFIPEENYNRYYDRY